MSSAVVAAIVSAILSSGENAENLSLEDTVCMAENIFYEARGETLDAQIIVGHVVLNRAANRKKTICEVVHQKNQFSWTIAPYEIDFDDEIENAAFVAATNIAIEVMTGKHDDMNIGANYYFNPEKLKKLPGWVSEMTPVGVYGNHHFYAG